MSVYNWNIQEALNANIDKEINWKIGQLAGCTNGSMRQMMRQIIQYIKDATPRKTNELKATPGYAIEFYSDLAKSYPGLRCYMIAHRDSADGDKFKAAQLEVLPIYLYDTKSFTYQKIKKAQLKKGGCYEMLFCNDLAGLKETKGCWLVTNYQRMIHEAELPIGTILAYGSDISLPQKWAWCHGQSLEKAKYKSLYNIIKDIWGKEKDETKFKLPDFRGTFLRGLDPTNKFGDKHDLGILQESCNKAHKHSGNLIEDGEHYHKFWAGVPDGTTENTHYPEYFVHDKGRYLPTHTIKPASTHKHKVNVGMDQEGSAENKSKEMRPVNYAVSFIIKIE